MTEKAQDALPVVEQDAVGKPIPQVSGGSADAGSATTGPDVSALDKRLAGIEEKLSTLDRIDDKIDARFKSSTDKRFQNLQQFKDALDEAKGDVKLAARNMLLDEMLEERKASPAPSSGGDRGRSPAANDESLTAKFLNELKDESGVELTDEELHRVWDGKRYTALDDAFKDAKKAAWKKAKGESIGLGAAATGGGKQVTQSDTDDELLEQYEKASKQPVGKAEELKRLREEAKKRGLLK